MSSNVNKPKALIIGASMVDIMGKSEDSIIMQDSNPGTQTFQAGGVSHNIACNLSRLNTDVSIISTICSDSLAKLIINSLEEANVNYDHVYRVDANSPSYMAVLDDNGDMVVAISDTRSLDLITPEFLSSKKDFIDSFDFVVVDACLEQEDFAMLFKNHPNKKFYLETVSIGKSKHAKPFLSDFYSVKCSELEAGFLADHKINDKSDCIEAAKILHSKGIEKVVITQGADGGFYSDKKEQFFYDAAKANIVNATGAGDAFMAGYIYGELNNLTAEKTMDIARHVSSMTIETIDTVNQSINLENIEERIKNEQ